VQLLTVENVVLVARRLLSVDREHHWDGTLTLLKLSAFGTLRDHAFDDAHSDDRCVLRLLFASLQEQPHVSVSTSNYLRSQGLAYEILEQARDGWQLGRHVRRQRRCCV